MEARSQLRHRPTWNCYLQFSLSFAAASNSLAHRDREARLRPSTSTRIWLANTQYTIGAPCRTCRIFCLGHFSVSFALLCWRRRQRRCASCGGRGRRDAAAGRLYFGQRIQRYFDAIAADGEEHANRPRKHTHREMEDRRFNQAADAGQCGVHSAQPAVALPEMIAQLNNSPEDSGSEFQTLPQSRRAL
jgi:hypothetical protein